MASKNSIRQYDVHAYYHVYNRGVEKRDIFLDDQDMYYFLGLLKRHLDSKIHEDKSGRPYPQYKDIELLAFCLMPNHYHLLIYQDEDPEAFTKLIRSVATAYTYYFNSKYKRVGHLFQDRFKASRISTDVYLTHISRYIHLNPKEPFRYTWSSMPYYVGELSADWVKPQRILSLFRNAKDYVSFVRDYTGHKHMLETMKYELADR